MMQFFFAPVLGGLSDRFGRRSVILLSLLGATASYLISGIAPALFWLFIGRTIAGITAASFRAAGAYVADGDAAGQASVELRAHRRGIRIRIYPRTGARRHSR